MITRMCPNAYIESPHKLRQDGDGMWYCPIERDAEAANAALERVKLMETVEYLHDQ